MQLYTNIPIGIKIFNSTIFRGQSTFGIPFSIQQETKLPNYFRRPPRPQILTLRLVFSLGNKKKLHRVLKTADQGVSRRLIL